MTIIIVPKLCYHYIIILIRCIYIIKLHNINRRYGLRVVFPRQMHIYIIYIYRYIYEQWLGVKNFGGI